jgi:mono/diheme cytochrome c family protein
VAPDAARWVAAAKRQPLLVGAAIVLGLLLVVVVGSRFVPVPDPINPISPAVDSLARGTQVYRNNCAACHGTNARGGGPMAGTTAVAPPALVGTSAHLTAHTDGELFRLITSGAPGGMPSWAGKLSPTEIWDVINFLRSLEGGQQL